MSAKCFVILGNSAAAIHAIKAIRLYDTASQIVLIAAEQCFAYSPVLTTYLIGRRIQTKDMFFVDEQFYAEHNVEALFGVKATKIEPDNKQVMLENGQTIDYDACLIATGSSPKKLGIDHEGSGGVFYLKTLSDAENILAYSNSAKDVLVIGGGLIGLQAANGLHRQGCRVTMLVGSKQLLSQNVDRLCAEMLAESMRSVGVDIMFESDVCGIQRRGSRLNVELNNDGIVEADMIVIGKGVQANIDLVAGSKIAVNRGILVDEFARTNCPDVYAAGDVAEGPCFLNGKHAVTANWLNACRQGHTAGSNMAGRLSVYTSLSENVTTVFDTVIAVLGNSNGNSSSCDETIYHGPGVYRKVVRNDKSELVGAVLLNEVGDVGLLSTAVRKHEVIGARFAEEIARNSMPFRI